MSPPKKPVLIDRYFKPGAQVEISGNEDGLIGSWFLAKIITLNKKYETARIEYKKLKEQDEKTPLRENVELIHLRPPPPPEERRKFNLDDDVDAYYHQGWWEGIVTGFMEETDEYAVFFRHSREQRAFKAHKMRLHREWVYGKWHPALEVRQDSNDVVVDEVTVKSAEVEVPVKSTKVKEPASKKRKVQPQDDLSTPSKVHVRSPKISRKIEGPVKSPKGDVPASKKCKAQPRDDLSTPSKGVSSPSEKQDVSSPSDMQDVSSPSKRREVPVSSEDTPNKQAEMQDEIHEVPVSSEYTPNKHGLRPGQIVEVSNDEEGFEGSWYSATLLKILNADKYLIKYQNLTCDDDKTLLIEEVDSLHIRPCPPEISTVDRFDTHEEVEALYNDGWWVGKISKVLKDDKYKVYFSGTDEEEKLKHSQLRVHQEWINGKWVNS